MALFTALMEKADKAEEETLELRVTVQEGWLMVQRESQLYTDTKLANVKEELLDVIRSLRTEYRGELATLHQAVKEERESEDGRVEMCDLRSYDRRLSVASVPPPPVVGAGWQGPPSCSVSAGHLPSPSHLPTSWLPGRPMGPRHRPPSDLVAHCSFQQILPPSCHHPTSPCHRSFSRRKSADFDGNVPREAYKAQFDILADAQSWSVDERVVQLVSSLRGSAVEILGHLTKGQRASV